MDHHLGRLSRNVLLALVALSTSCAPLFLAGKTPECRRQYDACLNGCPQPTRNPDPYVKDLQIDVAACTQECNTKAESCR